VGVGICLMAVAREIGFMTFYRFRWRLRTFLRNREGDVSVSTHYVGRGDGTSEKHQASWAFFFI